ncbi:TIF1G [Mytilus edulis]|uniref:TRIM33 n=1 Tax=Mytilus edulis TaxID=6550 RepID=A0A8S3V2T6_MYTED|nr:TIF1G [Mytilus edulis]
MGQSESTKQECHMCKKQNNLNTATHWCRDCVEAFCKECLRLHNLMKFSADHKVVKIDEIEMSVSGSETDLSLISDSCPIHKSKIFEAFCFDHQKLCCVLCLTLQHRKCETVHAFDEIHYLNKRSLLSSLESELIEMKSKVYELKEARLFDKEKLDVVFTEMELNASQHVLCLKEKLDSLLDVFIKKLNVTRDEQRLSSEEKWSCVFISETIVVLGGSDTCKDVLTGNIKTLDISTGNITSEYIIAETVKRLAYDFQSESLFVSCYSSKLHYLKFVKDFTAHVTLDRITESVGGTCVFEKNLYVIVEKAVQKVSIEQLEKNVIPQTCFKTDNVCSSINGLEIDCKNKRLLYTSSDFGVVCSSLEGHTIFSYKDKNMKSYCLAIFSQGDILIGDTNGSVHILSKDGKKEELLSRNAKKVVPIWDICLNKSNTSSVICGPDFIEIYDIVATKQNI